jgi:type II secretory pathway component PulJ
MDVYDAAKRMVCNIIAVALSMTVASVAAILPSTPQWLERVDQLAAQMQTIAHPEQKTTMRRRPQNTNADDEEEFVVNTDQLLLAYNQLWQFVRDLRSEGLSLDESFCERIEKEWSVTTLLTYMRNADGALQDHAQKAMDSAAGYLSAGTEASSDSNDDAKLEDHSVSAA